MSLVEASERLALEWATREGSTVGPREFLLAHFVMAQLADSSSDYGAVLDEITQWRWTAGRTS